MFFVSGIHVEGATYIVLLKGIIFSRKVYLLVTLFYSKLYQTSSILYGLCYEEWLLSYMSSVKVIYSGILLVYICVQCSMKLKTCSYFCSELFGVDCPSKFHKQITYVHRLKTLNSHWQRLLWIFFCVHACVILGNFCYEWITFY